MRFAAFAAALVAAIGLAGCGGGPQAPAGADALVIYSPHSDEIRQEFTEAFQAWYQAETGREVAVSWPDAGGGTDILKRLEDKFRAGRYDVDLVYGGGPIFDQMKQLGMLQPHRLPEDVLAAVPKTVAGQPLYDPDFTWYGAAISTFGLIYNKTIIADKRLPPVRDWQALADPAYFGLVGAGDPSKSASVRKAYEIILQAYGYERGMRVLSLMGANARNFYRSSSEIPMDCAKGFIALGPCIDFFALRQMRSEGGRNLGFLAPSGLTVVTCDPIGILKNAPHTETARKFVEFVMRPEGQRLWMLPAGSPGGPRQFTLERLAVLPGLYQAIPSAGERLDPFKVAPPPFYDVAKENDRQVILADYLRVALVENHAALAAAWKAVIAAGAPEDLVAELTRPLVSEDEMGRLGREVWTPLLVPDDATADRKASLTRQEEERQRRKSDLEAAWGAAVRERYAALAKATASAAP